MEFEQILQNYNALKELSFLINDTMGDVILMYMLDDIGSYSSDLTVVITTTDWLLGLLNYVYLGILVATFGISGNIRKEVKKIMRIYFH